MNRIDELFQKHPKPADFAKGYFKYLSEIFDRMDHQAIEKFVEKCIEARENGTKIFFIGNGGSAATASHFANDIGIGTRTFDKPFRALALTDNVASMTAIGNDYGYEDTFVKQLQVFFNPGDIVVAISASGNSPNVVKAIDWAKSKGGYTIGLTGFSGGKLREAVDLSLHVPSTAGEYGPVEDLHMILDHLLGNYLQLYVKSGK